jgi:hypothetical protein
MNDYCHVSRQIAEYCDEPEPDYCEYCGMEMAEEDGELVCSVEECRELTRLYEEGE